MSNPRTGEMVKQLTQNGGVMDYGKDNLHLLVHVVRELAKGQPVTNRTIKQIITELGIEPDSAEQFLRKVAERDDDDAVVGALGLSLKQHPHHFTVDGVEMTAWCALDTLFLPVMLQKTATVVSISPLDKQKIQLTVGPEGVLDFNPANAVMSAVIVDPDTDNLTTSNEIQMAFCRQVHFFASPAELEQWAAGRGDIETLPLREAYDLGSQFWPEANAYAKTL